MTWFIYRWEYDRDPGPFFGRWSLMYETDAEDLKDYYVNELQRDNVPVLVVEKETKCNA